ncbi:hypothetical protein [Burkholderia contaminans]|uniref:hypothetical protein n=1 Tax=Burkholderia contaminans TaxID=488447 RepID=UPI0015831FBC|nr:hypothetical protein [Burkholderia contaminans]
MWSRKRRPGPYAVLSIRTASAGATGRPAASTDTDSISTTGTHQAARARSAGSPRVSTQRKVKLAGKSCARRVCVDPFHAWCRAIVPGCGASGACAPGGEAGVPAQPAVSAQASDSNGTSG